MPGTDPQDYSKIMKSFLKEGEILDLSLNDKYDESNNRNVRNPSVEDDEILREDPAQMNNQQVSKKM
jgi:hypothetical protein